MRKWETVFPPEDRQVYERSGFLTGQEPGNKPALVIIDVVESFTGTRRMEIEKAQEEYSTSCGQAAWDAIDNIKKVLQSFREKGLTVVYVKGSPVNKYFCGSSVKAMQGEIVKKIQTTPINREIAPLETEFVLEKTKASAFFCTPLVTYLNRLHVDTLYIAGTTTSGCIRASVVDAFSYGYKVFLLEECVFDRSQFSHLVNLYEMNAKYADVITVDEFMEKHLPRFG